MRDTWKVDFIGIGPMKAGTTWTGHVLASHPQICMAEPKEVHYFNDHLSLNQLYKGSHFSRGLDWYASHFRHCDPTSLKGEITPRYMMDEKAPERIFSHNPDIKLFVNLRDPFSQIVSHYHSTRDFHKSESRTISQAIREESEYIEPCRYYKHISRYLQYFRPDQIFFVDMDAVRHHPEQVIQSLYAFLGVSTDHHPKSASIRSNPARSSRSVVLRKLTHKLHRGVVALGLSRLVLLLKKLGIGSLINRLNSAPVEKVVLSDADKQFIREQLSEDIHQFGKLINMDLSHWMR